MKLKREADGRQKRRSRLRPEKSIVEPNDCCYELSNFEFVDKVMMPIFFLTSLT